MRLSLVAAVVLAAPLGAAGTSEPEAKAAPESVSSTSGYELRGFFGSGADLEVSVRKAGESGSRWLKVGQKSGDLLVEKADPKAGTATLVASGLRHRLRLAGEAAPGSAAVAEEKPVAPDIKSREYRRQRFREMMEKASEAQKAEFGRVMRERFEKLRAENPDFEFHNPDNAEKMTETSLAIMRDAAEAAHKLPDKDGKITPVPADFEVLVREEMKANREAMKRRPAGHEKPVPAPGSDEKSDGRIEKTGSGTLQVGAARETEQNP